MEKILLTPEEVAQALNISRTKVFELLQVEALKSVKIGKSRRIPAEAVREFVACLTGEQGHRLELETPRGGATSWPIDERASGSPRPTACASSARTPIGRAPSTAGQRSVGRDLVGARGEAAPCGVGEDATGGDRATGSPPGAGRPCFGELRTVGSLADWWLQNVHKHAVRPSTWAKAEDRVRRIKATLGELPVTQLDYRAVTEWQAALGRTLAPRTVRHHRQTLAQIVDEAVKMGALVGNPVRPVKPVRVTDSAGVALEPDETRALLDAVGEHRLAAAVALLFLQGWRVSEALGLAWEDVDLDAGTAHVRRASVYVDGHGQRLGPTKTDGARGEHWLMPTVVTLRTKRCEIQAIERAAAPNWQTHTYEGEEVNLVFTTPSGGLVLRQAIAKLVKQAARTAGIEADLGTHAGRRTVVTSLFVDGHEALEDIARFVGHAKPSTTAGYVKRLGRRPEAVARRAMEVLDAHAEEDSPTA